MLNETSPTVIRKILKERLPKEKLPSAIKIANKIAHNNQKQVSATKQVLTTGDLRKLISENSQIDYNDESKSYAGKNLVIDGTFCTILFNTVQEGNFLHLHIMAILDIFWVGAGLNLSLLPQFLFAVTS